MYSSVAEGGSKGVRVRGVRVRVSVKVTIAFRIRKGLGQE